MFILSLLLYIICYDFTTFVLKRIWKSGSHYHSNVIQLSTIMCILHNFNAWNENIPLPPLHYKFSSN